MLAARILGGLAALASAVFAGLIVWVGILGAFLETRWQYRVPRSDPSASVGEPYPPWGLEKWLGAGLIEVAALAATVALLAIAGALFVPALRGASAGSTTPRAVEFGKWAWAYGTLALGIFAAIMHLRNWLVWHEYLDDHVRVPHFYELTQFVGVPILVLIGSLPAWFMLRRRPMIIPVVVEA